MTPTGNQTDGDRVRWESDGEPRYGIIVDDQTGEADADEVLVAVYAWDGDEWVRGDDTVNLAEDTFEVIEQFPSEPADEPVDNVAAAVAATDDDRTLAERVTHATHILTGQSSGCSCGGHADDGGTETHETNTTMSDTDIEALAEELGVAVETLEAMDDEEVESLASNVGSDDDGGTDDGGDGATNADDDEPSDEVTALREQVESLTDEIQDLKETQNADPQAEAAREFLAENTDREVEALAEWPDEAVVETAQANGFGANYAAPRGDRVNRLGQAGGPAAHESDDEDAADYVGKAGAFNQMDAEAGGD